MNIKIIIATHKPYRMPNADIYLPLHVGRSLAEDIGFIGDDTGDNISDKNLSFCELTGIYWMWKNLDADYVGVVHYRRHFSLKMKKGAEFDSILNTQQACELLKKYDVILPKKQNYYIETIYSHYAHTHTEQHLLILKEVLKEKSPEYLPSFENLKKRTSAHMFNMFIMKREIFDLYAQWLFEIIFELEKRIDISNMTSFESRAFGTLEKFFWTFGLKKIR